MFTVRPHLSVPDGLTLVSRVTQFGFYGVPMTFMVTSEVVPTPLPLRFTVKLDGAKKGPELGQEQLSAEGMDVFLINPHENGPTGNLTPMEILFLSNPPTHLLMSFVLARVPTADRFLIHIEFYERAISAPTQTKPMEPPP